MEQENQKSGVPNPQEQLNNLGGQNGDLISMLLPLLSGGGLNQETIFKMLAQNNPRLGGIMQLMPMLSKMQSTPPKQKPQNQNYIKISDYYKK